MTTEGWDFSAGEERDGLRFTWNEWPTTRAEAHRCVVPVACLYTPLKQIESMPPALQYEPIRCKSPKCQAILNPYCQIDFNTKLWACPFCLTRNAFPPHYAQNMTPEHVPAELIPQFTTLEYEIPNHFAGNPVFVFVVDSCLSEEDLQPLKDSLQQALSLLPDDALIGFVSFGKHVHIHEIGFTDCPKSYVFKGTKDLDPSALANMLGLHTSNPPGMRNPQQGQSFPGEGKFIARLGDAQIMLDSIIEDLSKDPWPKPSDQRPERATGVALSIASSLLAKTVGRRGARIQLFTGGPATIGPGKVVDRPYKEEMRGHTDLHKDNQEARHFKEARAFYDTVAARCVSNCHVVDVFGCSLDQFGLLEMKTCVASTGGLVVMADDFKQSVFKESFRRTFSKFSEDSPPGDAGNLTMGFAATLEIQTSREFKVAGAIGPCTSRHQKTSCVSDQEIGEGGTNAWALGGIDLSTTVAIYFDITNPENSTIAPGKQRFIQLITRYQHSNGRIRMRVTTHGGMWCPDASSNLSSLAASFDQEAAAVALARLAVRRAQDEGVGDIFRWLDRSLIRICSRFADYQKGDASSFRLQTTFSIFPQFMFHLRRSAFLQVFNSSPDETTYKRLVLMREDVTNSLVMIQPSLIMYSFQGPPQPVLLDASSVRSDVILLLDTFFTVVVFHGETIAMWRNEGYQNLPEHVAFKNLLEAPTEDAANIMENRFPVPRYITCDQGKSQARFLTARLNPSVTHNNQDPTGTQPIFTDDVSFYTFMEHLTKLAVEE